MGNLSKEKGQPPSFEEAIADGGGGSGGGSGSSSGKKKQQQQQQPPVDASPFRTRFACVTLAALDRIRFIDFPLPVVNGMTQVIASSWPRGIQDRRLYAGAYEFKLRGHPWSSSSRGDSNARRLVRRLLEALYDSGWVLHMAVDVVRKETGKGEETIKIYYIHVICIRMAGLTSLRNFPQIHSSSATKTRLRRPATGSLSPSTEVIASRSSIRRLPMSAPPCCAPLLAASPATMSLASISRSSFTACPGFPRARTQSRRRAWCSPSLRRSKPLATRCT
jgi:hypothetical protein